MRFCSSLDLLFPAAAVAAAAGAIAVSAGDGRRRLDNNGEPASPDAFEISSLPSKKSREEQRQKLFLRSLSETSNNDKQRHEEKPIVKALRLRLKNSGSTEEGTRPAVERQSCALDLGVLMDAAGGSSCPSNNDVCVYRGALGYDEEAWEESPLPYSDDLTGICVPGSYLENLPDNFGYEEGHYYDGDKEYHHSPADGAKIGSPASLVGDYDKSAEHRRLESFECGDYVVVATSDDKLAFRDLISNCVLADSPDESCTDVPVAYWDTSYVTDMRNAFEFATFNEPLTCWSTSRVTFMYEMFFRSTFNQPVDSWDVSRVTEFEAMFQGTTLIKSDFNQCISSWYAKVDQSLSSNDFYDMFKHSSCRVTKNPSAGSGPWCQTSADGCFTDAEFCSIGNVGGDLATNCASGDRSVISGGNGNNAAGNRATVSGGRKNHAEGVLSTVSGGQKNEATAKWATISGGESNVASGDAASIGGGRFNAADGSYAVVSGGIDNTASGESATVVGGRENVAEGKNSVAMGVHATAKEDNSVVINLLEDESVSSSSEGQLLFQGNKFTLRIGDTTVDIDENNIDALDDLLNGRRRRRALTSTEDKGDRRLREQVETLNQAVANEKEINAKQKEINAKQNEAIAKQNEAIAELNGAIESMRATIEAFDVVKNSNAKNSNQQVN